MRPGRRPLRGWRTDGNGGVGGVCDLPTRHNAEPGVRGHRTDLLVRLGSRPINPALGMLRATGWGGSSARGVWGGEAAVDLTESALFA